jgi:hypothetical protein
LRFTINLMSDKTTTKKEIKRIKKSDIDARSDSEKSIEVNFMMLLIRKYPDKAKDAVKKLPQVVEFA